MAKKNSPGCTCCSPSRDFWGTVGNSVVKYVESGPGTTTLDWSVNVGSATNLALDSLGNTYTARLLLGDIVVKKIDTNGTVVINETIPQPTSNDYLSTQPSGIEVNADGSVLIFAQWGASTVSPIILMKLDVNLIYDWVLRRSSVSTISNGNIFGVDVDRSGNAYCGSYFNNGFASHGALFSVGNSGSVRWDRDTFYSSAANRPCQEVRVSQDNLNIVATFEQDLNDAATFPTTQGFTASTGNPIWRKFRDMAGYHDLCAMQQDKWYDHGINNSKYEWRSFVNGGLTNSWGTPTKATEAHPAAYSDDIVIYREISTGQLIDYTTSLGAITNAGENNLIKGPLTLPGRVGAFG